MWVQIAFSIAARLLRPPRRHLAALPSLPLSSPRLLFSAIALRFRADPPWLFPRWVVDANDERRRGSNLN